VRFRVIAVGKPRDAAMRSVLGDFVDRATRYWPMEWIEVREESARSQDTGVVRAREGVRLRGALPVGGVVVACDANGAPWIRTRSRAGCASGRRRRAM
jgi:23S rRNA (pseudouridine1915-N3)-methyltransferase